MDEMQEPLFTTVKQEDFVPAITRCGHCGGWSIRR